MQMSVAIRNGRADSVEQNIGTAAVLKLWTAAKPVDVAAADAGTTIAGMTLPSDWMAAAASGAKAKSGTWEDLSADADGLIRHYRVYASDGTTAHLQGYCAEAWRGSWTWAVGQQVSNGGNLYVCTTAGAGAASGGPSGTGSSIADGAAVWDYLASATGAMICETTAVILGQEVTVDTFGWTEGNA